MAAAMSSARERNERFSERRGGQDVAKRKKQAMQRAAQRACRRQEKETSDSVSGTAGKTLPRERNKHVASGAAGKTSTATRERNARFSQRRTGQDVNNRKK
jgi:hypothetical protein